MQTAGLPNGCRRSLAPSVWTREITGYLIYRLELDANLPGCLTRGPVLQRCVTFWWIQAPVTTVATMTVAATVGAEEHHSREVENSTGCLSYVCTIMLHHTVLCWLFRHFLKSQQSRESSLRSKVSKWFKVAARAGLPVLSQLSCSGR